jgi:hypothetical protein
MSTLKVTTLQNLSGTEVYTAKAWVNFNGTGTVAIRAAGNISSITDNGTGDYTMNFTTAMADANYAPIRTINHTDPQGGFYVLGDQMSQTTTAFRFKTGYVSNFSAGGTLFDIPNIYVAVFR